MHEPTKLSDLFDGPWGIIESRRAEVEGGGFGTYEKVLHEEINKHFYDIDGVSEFIECHQSTARRWMADCECQYIVYRDMSFFEKTDVERIAKLRKEIRERRKKKNVE